jgi:hypothetical protein
MAWRALFRAGGHGFDGPAQAAGSQAVGNTMGRGPRRSNYCGKDDVYCHIIEEYYYY